MTKLKRKFQILRIWLGCCLRSVYVRTPAGILGIRKYVYLEDRSIDWGIVDEAKVGDDSYIFLINENNLTDARIRKCVVEDGGEYLVGLNAEDAEFETAWNEFYNINRVVSDEWIALRFCRKNERLITRKMRTKRYRIIRNTVLSIIIFIASGFIGYLSQPYISNIGTEKANVQPSNAVAETDGSLMLTHINDLVLLDDSCWFELSVQERLDLLQHIVNIESTALSLPEAPTVRAGNLAKGGIGTYNPRSKTIKISMDYLMSKCGFNNTQLVLHELFHSYVYYLLKVNRAAEDDGYRDMYRFPYAEIYAIEKAAMFTNNADFYSTTTELHADIYASEVTDRYLEAISNFLKVEG